MRAAHRVIMGSWEPRYHFPGLSVFLLRRAIAQTVSRLLLAAATRVRDHIGVK
jgi:hypothetical protein